MRALAAAGEGEIDLEAQEVRFGGRAVAFEIDAEIRRRLLGGLDDIALTLQQDDAIAAYEGARERSGPVTTARESLGSTHPIGHPMPPLGCVTRHIRPAEEAHEPEIMPAARWRQATLQERAGARRRI